MNLHTASSELSKAEIIELSTTQQNFIGAQASKPIVCIVQDCLLSCYLMTKQDDPIPKDTFWNLLMSMNSGFDIDDHLQRLQVIQDYTNDILPPFCGKHLFSLLLPSSFHYRHKETVIEHGILVKGYIAKANIGANTSSILCILHKEYSPLVAKLFVDNVQFLANAYMLYHGFSIGIADCFTKPEGDAKTGIQTVIAKSMTEASMVNTENLFIRESKINMAMGKARDVGMRLAKEGLEEDNHFIDTVTSGSKGDFFNIAQIMGLLGQQNITGARVKHMLNKETRTLPHYPFGDLSDETMKYESRGFISNSFMKGLNPREFWFHAMSGREGIVDTALKTASSGYIQRRMVKLFEDMQVKHDQSIRNSVGSILQFSYGGDNLCPTKTVLVNGEPQICDISRIAEKLNKN